MSTTDPPFALTGTVLAVADLAAAMSFWSGVAGLVPAAHAADASGRASLRDPRTGQVVTLVAIPRPDPPLALALRCDDLETATRLIADSGFVEHWRDTDSRGTQFVMCRDERGAFLLLYQPAADAG